MSRKKGFFTYTGLFLIIFVLGFLVFFVQGKSFVWNEPFHIPDNILL